MNIHYTESYLLDPVHPITVFVIGAGGTGSMVLSGLARMNYALLNLGHKGLHVTVFDHDTVTEANPGRQLFAETDIGMNKAEVLVNRINRFFGFSWEAMRTVYKTIGYANIIITCVDTKDVRVSLHKKFKRKQYVEQMQSWTAQSNPYYWLDLGNTSDKGQVVLSTLCNIKQPESKHTTFERLKTIIDMFPKYSRMKEDKTPSCSLADALSKQDLFINSTVAQYGLTLLWRLLREHYLTQHGAFINLENFKTNPIMI